MQEARRLFSSTGIKLATDGQRDLGAAIGTFNFRAQYTSGKVTKLCNEPHRLADFAKTQPHAYSAFTHRILSQYTHLMRTRPGMNEFIKPVDDVIRLELLPTLLNSIVPGVDRQLYSLPLSHGGLGIPILSEIAESQFEASKAIALPLVTIMITQSNTLPNETEVNTLPNETGVNEIKRKIKNEQKVRISERALKVEQNQTPHTLKVIQDTKMPGASSWLGVLPSLVLS